jgi:hypothetical protein
VDLVEDIPYDTPSEDRPEGGRETQGTHAPQATHVTQASPTHRSKAWVACVPQAVFDAIEATLPTGPGQRNRKLFDLVRRLKGIPGLDKSYLKSIVQQWHRLALPTIRTKAFAETWEEFQVAWVKVLVPYGIVLAGAIEAARRVPHQPIDDKPELGVLAALCSNLAVAAEGKPFFLSCRTVEELFEVPRMTAWRWLGLLQFHGIIVPVMKGTKRGQKATTWRYVAERDI